MKYRNKGSPNFSMSWGNIMKCPETSRYVKYGFFAIYFSQNLDGGSRHEFFHKILRHSEHLLQPHVAPYRCKTLIESRIVFMQTENCEDDVSHNFLFKSFASNVDSARFGEDLDLLTALYQILAPLRRCTPSDYVQTWGLTLRHHDQGGEVVNF
jgi:hypothetical protein